MNIIDKLIKTYNLYGKTIYVEQNAILDNIDCIFPNEYVEFRKKFALELAICYDGTDYETLYFYHLIKFVSEPEHFNHKWKIIAFKYDKSYGEEIKYDRNEISLNCDINDEQYGKLLFTKYYGHLKEDFLVPFCFDIFLEILIDNHDYLKNKKTSIINWIFGVETNDIKHISYKEYYHNLVNNKHNEVKKYINLPNVLLGIICNYVITIV